MKLRLKLKLKFMKKYFETRKEAIKSKDERNKVLSVNKVFRLKHGRNKGKFFVGSELEWLNL